MLQSWFSKKEKSLYWVYTQIKILVLQPWHVYGNINRWFNIQNFVCTCLYKHGLLRMKYIQRKFISQEIAQNYLCYERLYWIFIFKKIVIKLFVDDIDKSHWNNEINFKSWMKSLLLNALLYYSTWKNLVNVPSFKRLFKMNVRMKRS